MRRPGEMALMGFWCLVRAADADETWKVMKGDPYITSVLCPSIDLTEITPSIGLWVGGKIWADTASIAHRATGSGASFRSELIQIASLTATRLDITN